MLVGCSSVEPSNTMNTAVIYLKQDYENGAATVARINLAMVKECEDFQEIIKDGEYFADVNLITKSLNEDTGDFIFTMASERIAINEMALRYFGADYKVVNESAWREMWTSAWCVYSPYK